MIRPIVNAVRRLRRLDPFHITSASIVGGVLLIDIVLLVEAARRYALPAHFV